MTRNQIIMDSLRCLVQALRQSSVQCEQKAGLTGAQVFILRLLQAHPAISINELTALTHTHQSTVSEAVTRLENKGFITRRRCLQDGRRWELSLSDRGEAIVSTPIVTAQEHLLSALDALPETQRARLAEGLSALVDTAGLGGRPPRLFFEDTGSLS